MLRRVLREPLVHFFVLGALIFAVYGWVDRNAGMSASASEIVIDQAKLDHLKKLWTLQWKREPSPSDLAAIIDREVRQEVFFREALKLKLEQNDQIIKKRLSQKMEDVAHDLTGLMKPPTDERLKAYFLSHEDLFKLPKAYAFKQIVFKPNEDDRDAHIAQSCQRLRGGGAIPRERVNALAVPTDWPLTSVNDLKNAFGAPFVTSLDHLPVGQWAGPIRSGYGFHLVQISIKQPARMPDFDKVKDFVAREYEYRSVLEAQDRIFKEFLDNYKVVISAGDVPSSVLSAYAR